VIASLLKKEYLKGSEGKYALGGDVLLGSSSDPCGTTVPQVLTNFNNPRYFLHPSLDRPFTLRECARLRASRRFLISSETVALVDITAVTVLVVTGPPWCHAVR